MSTKVTVIGSDVQTTTVTIANGTGTSDEIDLGGKTIVGLSFPSTLDGTALKYLVSTASGGTFVEMITTAGADVSHTVAASKYLPLDVALFNGVRFLKLLMGTNQTGATIVTVHYRVKT